MSSRHPSQKLHPILESLNPAQARAVTSDADTVAILAGPGSGKTHTLTSRVVWLVDHVGYRPEDVIVATFTVKAAREMQERIGKALGNGREKKLVLGTFHSIARRYLAAYGRKIGLSQKFGIADDGDSRSIITRIIKRLQLPIDPVTARAWISKKKARGPDSPTATGRQSAKTPGLQDLETCYSEYQSQLERSNLLDYDDLLVRCVELLQKFPSCVSNIQTVLIDEYQDTNGVQYELMKLFAQQRGRITVVGDPDQSIYGWRSAEIKNLWRLLREFPNTHEISLEENYRSSPSILDLSLLVIQQDKKRYQKVLKPIHKKGTRPVLRKLKSASVEAEWIVLEMRRAIFMSGKMLNHSDVAILLRSASLSRHIESALGKAGIPYKMVGGFKFYERSEIKTIIDYLRVIHQPENNDALGRIMNVPRRGIGEGTVKNLIEEAEKSSLSLWELLSKHCRGDRIAKTKLSKHAEQKISGDLFKLLNAIQRRIVEANDSTPFGLVEMIQHLLTSINFQKWLQDSQPEDHEQRWANVQEFVNMAADFARDLNNMGDDQLPEIDGVEQSTETEVLPKFLANVSLAADAQKGNEGHDGKPLVTISTIHAAKGLEWPIVFVPAVYKGSIPHLRSDDEDEERRLLYVAMTRAKYLLYLSYPMYSSHGSGEQNELSLFVEPISRAFANKGPCFEREIVSQMADVLGRELLPDQTIFSSLPSMFNPGDDEHPVDPDDNPEKLDAKRSRNNEGEGQAQAHWPRSKRPRISAPRANQDNGQEQAWEKGYATTMERSSSFTVSALPGFRSAGDVQVELMAANAEAEARRQAEKEMKAKKKRPADQKSILGFINGGSRSSSSSSISNTDISLPKLPPQSSFTLNKGRVTYNNPEQAKPAIDPSLSSHKLGGARMMARPTSLARKAIVGAGNEAGNQYTKPKEYACFSSSPPQPEDEEGTVTNAEGEEGKQVEEENDPPPEPTRSAACLHATTCNLPKGVGGIGGLRRPAGLSNTKVGKGVGLRVGGVTSIAGEGTGAALDRLRKPFKPLTMNRGGMK
ncbi:P-loop containing nucleoside triphosphate hydrolase protein [Naviculisporaceae sp. PSN 640]